MNCIIPTTKLYKDLSNLTNNNVPLIYYLDDVISMYQKEGFITQKRFNPDSGRIMYTIPKIIMEDSISGWMQSVGSGFKKDAKTKEKFEFILKENFHNNFVRVMEFDKAIVVEFLSPDPESVIPEPLDLEELVDEMELTESQISEEALRTQEENEDKEFSVVKPEVITGLKPGIQELFDSNPELANQIYQALGFNNIDESEISYTDENGKLCAANGLKPSKFKKGGQWEVIKEFKGKSHAQGGIDIEIGNGGIKMSNKQGKFEAKFGLLIPKNK